MIAVLILLFMPGSAHDCGASARIVCEGAASWVALSQDAATDAEREIEDAVVSSFKLADDSTQAQIAAQLIAEFRRATSGLPQDKIAEFLSQMTEVIRVTGATVSDTDIIGCPASKTTGDRFNFVWEALPDRASFMSEHDRLINQLNWAGGQYLSEMMNAAGMVRPVGSEVEKKLTEQFALLGRFLKDEVKPHRS